MVGLICTFPLKGLEWSGKKQEAKMCFTGFEKSSEAKEPSGDNWFEHDGKRYEWEHAVFFDGLRVKGGDLLDPLHVMEGKTGKDAKMALQAYLQGLRYGKHLGGVWKENEIKKALGL